MSDLDLVPLVEFRLEYAPTDEDIVRFNQELADRAEGCMRRRGQDYWQVGARMSARGQERGWWDTEFVSKEGFGIVSNVMRLERSRSGSGTPPGFLEMSAEERAAYVTTLIGEDVPYEAALGALNVSVDAVSLASAARDGCLFEAFDSVIDVDSFLALSLKVAEAEARLSEDPELHRIENESRSVWQECMGEAGHSAFHDAQQVMESVTAQLDHLLAVEHSDHDLEALQSVEIELATSVADCDHVASAFTADVRVPAERQYLADYGADLRELWDMVVSARQ